MFDDIFEFRRQARGPGNYLALGVVMTVMFLGRAQGWGLWAALLCGPFLAMVLVRLILNAAIGFRLGPEGLLWYQGATARSVGWADLDAVTITGDGAGGADCILHLAGGETDRLPGASAFAPERLTQEFRLRGVPVWRPAAERLAVRAVQVQ